MVCVLCGLEVKRTTKHHWIPRTRHKNKRNKREFSREEVKKTSDFCRPCHGKIHSLFTEKELERSFNNLESLKEHPDIQKWLEWRKKHPHIQGMSSKKAKE